MKDTREGSRETNRERKRKGWRSRFLGKKIKKKEKISYRKRQLLSGANGCYYYEGME